MPGAIHTPSDHPSPGRPANAHSRRTAKSTAVSSAPSCKQSLKSSRDVPSAKLLVVGTLQKYGVVFRSGSSKVPWWIIRLACLEAADPFIQLCLAPKHWKKNWHRRERSSVVKLSGSWCRQWCSVLLFGFSLCFSAQQVKHDGKALVQFWGIHVDRLGTAGVRCLLVCVFHVHVSWFAYVASAKSCHESVAR